MAGTSHDADSAGDLMLLVGPDGELIRASSKVLSLASPVFARMLGPHFAEGQSLLEKGSLENSAVFPTEVILPDDDPEAMILFCDTIHFRKHATPDIAFPILAKMASLSDKYDASLALSSASVVWLSNFTDSKEGESCLVKILWISYALGNHRAFSRISRAMIRLYSHDELARLRHEIDCTSIPEMVIDSIEEIRASDFSDLCDEIASVLTLHLKMPCRRKTLHQSQRTMCFHDAKSGHYVQELYRIGLWSITNTNTQKSIQEISDCLPEFENHVVGDTSNSSAYCDVAKADFAHLLLQARDTAFKYNRGLCLSCVKQGNIMNAARNCWVTSLGLCKDC